MIQKYYFKSTCKNCETEEESEYVGEIKVERKCAKCGKAIENEIDKNNLAI